jgi:hypothetical protein
MGGAVASLALGTIPDLPFWVSTVRELSLSR